MEVTTLLKSLAFFFYLHTFKKKDKQKTDEGTRFRKENHDFFKNMLNYYFSYLVHHSDDHCI